ncbi:DUF6504 family protein [Syntrophomonas palmitatica]|uniref:DUF6504 family protein n=1 Tax=Syntrophomonas palmitatica TaxID=402877 RepID=UPI0006D153B9|nr:DUF6504 family protein [Syntrophomonas palmitatica]
MSRILRQDLRVECDRDGFPLALQIRGKIYPVRFILERWRDTGCWWEGESEKFFFRVQCANGVICELFQDLTSRNWFLYKVYD